MNTSEMKRRYTQSGLGGKGLSVTSVITEVEIAHVGWEMDNKLWLVLLSDGSKQVLGTNHGGLCTVTKNGLTIFLNDAKDRFENLRSFSAEV